MPWITTDAHAESRLSGDTIRVLSESLSTTAYTNSAGGTHSFYSYPARFHPEVARDVISAFSRRGSWVLDPFMGGGTSIVEGLTLGRRMVGIDINSLAHFVSDVRTQPLSPADEDSVRRWADRAAVRLVDPDLSWVELAGIRNLPRATELFMAGALQLAADMLPRRRAFARAALLRLGQWALDCRDFSAPRRSRLAERLPAYVDDMILGLREFVASCRESGISKNAITGHRMLLHRSAAGIDRDSRIRSLRSKPRLVFTSPPYPGVHVLYHRWQYRGRRETPAPYWIANRTDGAGLSYYCGGSRTPTGIRNYFEMIVSAFSSVARVLHRDGTVVQIVGFSRVAEQLPLYLTAMEQAGFYEVRSSDLHDDRIERRVANRKWYAKLQGDVDAATEYLLIHRLR
ncbi:MAG: hypothetical protein IPK00_27080 [Deltaproteobacteria bacterium]|nr:hypothetical protein [Deltaproteobacteria bacterium]